MLFVLKKKVKLDNLIFIVKKKKLLNLYHVKCIIEQIGKYMSFQKKNNLIGWYVFTISLIVYILTIEPTLSLWDCGELLVSAIKLEISHSPGAPLFMLLGRIFSLLSFGDMQKAAMMVNMVSAVSSAGTVMFLFWTIVWLLRKISSASKNGVLVPAAIGALAYAFTDSFWFSAVEAEVYALSSLFVALLLWTATRWEREADSSNSNRWVLLIFFLTGLSIGVHLLNLLVLPTVAMIIYFKKYKPTFKGVLLTITFSGFFILFLMKIFIPGVFSLAGPVELLAVNSFGLPVNSGFYFYLFLLVTVLAGLIFYSHKKRNAILNLVVLCTVFLLLGYTSYMTSFIRSSANPPVDQNNPETTFELINYLNRESYGSRPILYGENYGSVIRSYRDRKTYDFDGEKYFETRLNPKVFYDESTTGFFPRLHSKDKQHMEAYQNWVSMDGKKVRVRKMNGETVETTIPTFTENVRFFLRYQLGHMYVRYFMWNFAGRQNDVQGFGGPLKGNWQSGIKVLNEIRLGDQSSLPTDMRNNKARNSYYFLPLILGLIGLWFHYQKDKNTFWTFILLFAIMSVGLVIYLNEIPITPRERDYVFVGSFYVFAIWIGLGAMAIIQLLSKKMKMTTAIIVGGTLGVIAAPGILIQQNYDDHDRSGRYTARDLARNYLECCEPNAILFTHADNDTYPLWYCQEVEGIRTDVRVVVMPYLNAGWYIKQINRKINDNDGVKLSIPEASYRSGELDYLPIVPKIKTAHSIQRILDFVSSDSAQAKIPLQSGEKVGFIPVDKMNLVVGDTSIPVSLNKDYLMRNELVFWDILNSNINERPVYFTSFADPKQYGLKNYLRYDGLVYKLIPEYTKVESILDMGKIDSSVLYENLMNKCNWENQKNEEVYFDWHHRRMFAVTHMRQAFSRLAQQLIDEGDKTKAFAVIREGEEVLPSHLWPSDFNSISLARLYFEAGDRGSGQKSIERIQNELEEWLDYFSTFQGRQRHSIEQDYTMKLYLYQLLTEVSTEFKYDGATVMNERLKNYFNLFKGV